mgnify:CR=1 FL=1
MGWKSTEYITREEAIQKIRDALEDCSNETLAETVEAVLGGCDHGYNYMVSGSKRNEAAERLAGELVQVLLVGAVAVVVQNGIINIGIADCLLDYSSIHN